ncbi:hypothetical protein [Gloeothece verrucosa]|uniref:Uncharacterized protein n=1 Tax=Gloeothece verrucosa (strain PCC 7822) TaxID=497965 RepID=E0U6Y0_GLOV7|nr:hypothetical protein [Gloeothece verrucosa]ADN16017.1 conserved hypothetical protein [Gloeothece verrucosa PCC 7822]ADN16475.1 conserved hypothetical protein [Gloeothece verrucosa PCC 7822]
MNLPPNFDDWEHHQSTLMQIHNRRVRRAYSDLGGEDWVPDITTARGGLRVACTIKDSDNALICLSKQLLFWLDLGFISDYIEPIYGYPVEEVQANIKFKPQITLHFKEDAKDVEKGFRPLRMRVSFRLVNETSKTITKGKLITIGEKIDNKFGANHGYKFHKGKDLYTYKDEENGYDFQLYSFAKSDAKDLIGDVLHCNNDTPSWKHFKTHEDEEPMQNYPTVPDTEIIFGERVKEARKRPVGYVRYEYTSALVNGLTNRLIIHDRTHRFNNVLVRD